MKSNENFVNIIGAGLAGCESALYLAKHGRKVRLYECKPLKKSPAHSTDKLGELVCSNSLKSDILSTASGLLKAEMRVLGSELIRIADSVRVPAGSALAVDREKFSDEIEKAVYSNSNIEVVHELIDDFDENEYTIIATGPLTVGNLNKSIADRLGGSLHFYDAAAPIIDGASIDYNSAFTADRYGRGEGDYVNCPMNKQEYETFYSALISAECAVLKEFEKSDVFEGCMPVEIMAKRGVDTLRFGPLRPVGFRDNDGNRPYAVVQLRRENTAGDSFNIVGFQTNLKFGEQERVFRLIPALSHAEFLRYGVMHRNTFINAPEIINKHFQTKKFPKIFIAGQLSGVEGYVESMVSGLIAAMSVNALLSNAPLPDFPPTTIVGALTRYLETPNTAFQPMNANFGLLPPAEHKIRDKTEKKLFFSDRSLKDLKIAEF